MANLAIIAPTFSELRATARRLDAVGAFPVFKASFPGHKVVLGVVGVGENAARGTARIIGDHRPDAVALIGVAGALSLDLKVGTLLSLARCVDLLGNDYSLADPSQRNTSTVLTVDGIVDTPERKIALREKHNADLVDMETAHVARAAAERRVPLTSARVVSDAAGDSLPADFMKLITPDGRADFWAAVKLCVRRPGYIPRLTALGKVVDGAGEQLAEWSERWLADF